MSDPADRRRYERFEIRLPARIHAADSNAVACVVHDYCSGGMLLSLQPGQRADAFFSIGETARLTTQLMTHAGPRPITIKSTVAWMRDRFLGIEFAKPSDLIVEVLKRHDRYARAQAGDASSKPLGAAGTPTRSQPARTRSPVAEPSGPYFDDIRQAAQRIVPGMLREIVGQTVDTLIDSVNRVPSDVERQQVYGDMSALQRLRQDDTLMRAVMQRALSPGATSAPDGGFQPGELALVDTDEFERWLEASRTATLVERGYKPEIAMIGARIIAARDSDAPASLLVPFEPKHFTDAFSDVARETELGAFKRGVLFERCAEVLGDSLGTLYRELDTVLDNAGVPKQDMATAMRVVHGVAREGSASIDAAQVERVLESDDAGQSLSATAPAAASVAIDPQRLQKLLDEERELRQRQATELVGGLAAEIAGDRGLDTWVERIGGAMIAEASVDPSFFQNDSHPLRSIIDRLGHLQHFFAGPDDETTRELRGQIDSLLEPLADGEVDSHTLGAVAAEIDALTRVQSTDYQRNVERVIEGSEGRDRVRRARALVAKELDRRYAGHRVPEVLPDLLDVGWRAGLELAWLNAESGRGEYQRQLALLDRLVDLLGGESYAHGKDEDDKTTIAKRIDEQLATTAVDPYRRGAVVARIHAELNGPAVDIHLIPMPGQGHGEIRAKDDRPEHIAERDWRQAIETCRALRLGDSVESTGDTHASNVLRIAWMRADRESFTLVDHRGLRVRDISLRDLAQAVYEDRMRVEAVDGSPLSQRAVRRMLAGMEDRLVQQTAHDSVTGLMNRRQFHVALEKAAAARESGVLLWIDIDQFRLVNEMYDYATGDRLLAALARVIEECPGEKVVAHLGGDRFGVLLAGIFVEKAFEWAERLLAEVRSLRFDWQAPSTTLHVSIGLAGIDEGSEAAADLTRAVEYALTAAKKAGGDQAYIYRDDDPTIAQQRDSVEWLVRVDEALVDGRLHLRGQPIVPVRPDAGLAPHVEVLLGVSNAADEALPIAEFIEAAERYKRMRAVDRWITREVFDWVVANRDLMPSIHGLAVNLSGQTVSDPTFVEFVRQQFNRTGIEPHWISFEVTETAAVASLSHAVGIIHGLRGLGCRIALDDFGSGQASYSYLKELPVDWLKIDGVFVRNITSDSNDLAVVKSINEIGHFLGKKTIAEYVKDAATLEMIREIGVDYAQGFGVARPLLLDDLAAAHRIELRRRSIA